MSEIYHSLEASFQLGTTTAGDDDKVWSSIPPSTELTCRPCYTSFQCARLIVPLYWHSNTSKPYKSAPTAILAIIKLPAIVPPSHANHGGTIITNPGGPGSSGVLDLANFGELMRAEFDSPDRHFDVVSFDPRGVMFSTPSASCFADESERERWVMQTRIIGNLDSGPEATRLLWARAKALGMLCGDACERAGDKCIFEHMTTAVMARDMLALVDSIEEERKASLRRGVSHSPSTEAQARLIQENDSVESEESSPKLNFWGFSGGRVLGNTFASLYPDRVGRMLLDAVLDADDYALNSWTSSLHDTENVMQYFYESCFEAGADKCSLYQNDGPEAIKNDIQELLTKFKHQPFGTIQHDRSDSMVAEVVTYSDLKNFIFWSLFSPRHSFSILARGLSDLKHGNASIILSQVNPYFAEITNLNSATTSNFLTELLPAISCADGPPLIAQTYHSFLEYLSTLQDLSPTIGSILAQHNRLACTGWLIRPKWPFEGPFGGNTTGKILFVGNERDPVTPVRNARKMARLFQGGALLVVEATGHGYIAGKSRCREDAVRDFFRGAEVDGEKWCEADEDDGPFSDTAASRSTASDGRRWRN